MHGFRFVSFHKIRLVSVSSEKLNQFVVAEAAQDRRVSNLVAVQVKDGKHGSIPRGIQKLVGMPTCGERTRLALAVADNAAGQQVGIVEDSAVGMRKGVAQFTALVD